MTLEPSKRHASECLSAWNFHVEEIPPLPNGKRADLRATWKKEEYVVEAKMRNESESWLDLVSTARRNGGATASRPVVPWNSISSTIRHAHEQLIATPAGIDALRVLWIPALHEDDDFVLDCVEKRLFGLERLSVVKKMSMEEIPTAKPCYYHGPADFRRFRTIDAAVLATRKGGRLCVNSFSPNLTRLRTSRLCKIFDERGATRDPEILEQKGVALLLGEDFIHEPTGRNAWSYIRRKYGVLTSRMSESNFNALVSVPADDIVGRATSG